VPGKTNRAGRLDAIDASMRSSSASRRTRQRAWIRNSAAAEVATEAALTTRVCRASDWRVTVGVFIGIATGDYSQWQERSALIDGYASTGNAFSIAANRISYLFDLHGPSLAVDTACSSSLVAVHLACESLRRGECVLALAGGVNAILSPGVAIGFTKAGVTSPDGHCKAFDSRANGYVRGEGAAVVVLKRLSAAIVDGDRIHAVIRGSAVNQDGRTNGILAPSRAAQEAVLREA
jgi:polyketide synthase 12